MKTFYSPRHLRHRPDTLFVVGQLFPWSPDALERAETIRATLVADGYTVVEGTDHGLAPLTCVHAPEYLEYLRTAWSAWTKAAEDFLAGVDATPGTHVYPFVFPAQDGDVTYPRSIVARAGFHSADMWLPIGEETWEAAYWSANLAVDAADAVLAGDAAAYALCRPSGHHAYAAKGGGNCYLNNAAIAAERLLRGGRERIALIDIDVHHGNGTQGLFYDRDDVLFVSLHGDPHELYPYFVGHPHERGAGRGTGYTLNLPVPIGSGIETYLSLIEIALDRIKAFSPDTLVVSLGVDTHENDISRGLKITTADFSLIGKALASLRLPTVLVQEGGYDVESIGRSVANVLEPFAAR